MASGCTVEIWSNIPHRMCIEHPQKEAEVAVPLGEGDVIGKKIFNEDNYWHVVI